LLLQASQNSDNNFETKRLPTITNKHIPKHINPHWRKQTHALKMQKTLHAIISTGVFPTIQMGAFEINCFYLAHEPSFRLDVYCNHVFVLLP